jgi:hypothetical protein
MGSTSNALDKGGENFKKLYYNSDVTKRNRNGQTASGLYSLFIPMEWNYEGFMDTFGLPVFTTPKDPVLSIDNTPITTGVIEHWENEVEGLKNDADSLNEYYRQFPRTEQHAFRDETKNSLFNLTKIYEQIDYNEYSNSHSQVTRGSFRWLNDWRDSEVEFYPNQNGRFLVSWVPVKSLQNIVILKNGVKFPGNEHIGAFGCDSYDISGTVDGRGSKGALHGLTKFSMEDAPPNHFFLEYVARPQTAEIFFEDVLMACHFYGMPILIENNKPRLLYYLKRRGYRGLKGEKYGDMYFQDTLEDWAGFNINNRTKHDATISSGLAIMACNKNRYRPVPRVETKSYDLGIKTFDNSGEISKINY